MTHCRLLIVLFALCSITQAQTLSPNPDNLASSQRPSAWIVKFAPLSLFDPDNTIQFGVERLLGGHNAIQAEFGYGWPGMNLWRNSQNQRYSDREIWRGRAEWRYYFSKTAKPIGRYVAIEGFYKQVNVRESGTIGVGCETGPCQYYQLYSSPLSKHVWGGHIKIGRQFRLIPDNDRWLVDFYAGIGFRKRTIERFARPNGSIFYDSGGFTLFDSFSGNEYATLSAAYGIKLGFAF